MASSGFPFRQLLTAYSRGTLHRALYLAVPPYILVGIVSFILFAGNGLDAKQLTALATQSPALRFALLGAWCLLTLPVTRQLVTDPTTFFLRVLPVSQSWPVAISSVALVVVHSAWLLLWAFGAGALGTVLALLAAIGVQCVWIAPPRRVAEWLALGCILGGWGLLPQYPSVLLLLPAASFELRQAWLRAPEPPAVGRHAVPGRSSALALACAFGVAVKRSNPSAVLRMLLITVAAYVLGGLAIQRNPQLGVKGMQQWLGALWEAAALLGTATLTKPILSVEIELGWLFDVIGTSPRLRIVSQAGLLGGLFALLGGVVAGGLPLVAPRAAGAIVELSVQLALSGACWALLVLWIVRITTRGRGRDAGRQLLVLLPLFVASQTLLWTNPAYGQGFLSAISLVAVYRLGKGATAAC